VGPLTIHPQSLRLKADITMLMQNLACAINSMVLCYFTTYGLIPRSIHDLAPDSFLHRALAGAFEHSGPALRVIMKLKSRPMLWFAKWLTYMTGTPFSSGHIQEIGARIFNLERMYNLREGFSAQDDTLPPRLLNEPAFPGMVSGHPLQELLPRYYKLRGWDADGVPTARTLERYQVKT
jgi:aldehyde:ferredoxin oxidoreductase